MSDVQENHGNPLLAKSEKNSKSMEALPVGSGEREEMDDGLHLPHTTSGITTMVLPLFAEIWDSVKV
jgi:hypothetical protein